MNYSENYSYLRKHRIVVYFDISFKIVSLKTSYYKSLISTKLLLFVVVVQQRTVCDGCGKTFRRSDNLVKHNKRRFHEQGKQETPTAKSPFLLNQFSSQAPSFVKKMILVDPEQWGSHLN